MAKKPPPKSRTHAAKKQSARTGRSVTIMNRKYTIQAGHNRKPKRGPKK